MVRPYRCLVCGVHSPHKRHGWCDLCRRARAWAERAKGCHRASAKECRTAREHHRVLKLYAERAAREEPLFG